jgi:hypothetical protein
MVSDLFRIIRDFFCFRLECYTKSTDFITKIFWSLLLSGINRKSRMTVEMMMRIESILRQ